MRETIDEIRGLVRDWNTVKVTEPMRKQFLQRVNEYADTLGVSLTVEHLLPCILEVFQNPRTDPEKFQIYVEILFKELGQLVRYLKNSEIAAGYDGIRDHLIPLYEDFFRSDSIEDSTRNDL